MFAGLALRAILRLVIGPWLRSGFLKEAAKTLSHAAWIGLGLMIFELSLPWVFPPRFEIWREQFLDVPTKMGWIVVAALIAIGVWEALCNQLLNGHIEMGRRAERLLIPFSRKFVRAAIIIGAILVAFAETGRDVSGALAGLGIGGLVMALAAKDSVENLFGSVTILFDMPFTLGDWVKIDKIEGTIEEINLRSTRIRTFEDSVVTLPNSNLIKAAVENFGARRVRRQRFMLRVSHSNSRETIRTFCERLEDHLLKAPETGSHRVIVRLIEVGEQSMGILVEFFIEVADFKEETAQRAEVLEYILDLRDEVKLTFAEKQFEALLTQGE